MLRAVLDTNGLVAGLRRKRGTAAAILDLVERRIVQPAVPVALVLEHEAVLKRPGMVPAFNRAEINLLRDQFISRAIPLPKTVRWRPFLSDPADDLLVEPAFSPRASYLVTANERHLAPARSLGVQVLSPGQFLAQYPHLP